MQTKEYKASLDGVGKAVSVVVTLLLLFSCVIVAWTTSRIPDSIPKVAVAVSIPLMLFTIIICYFLAPVKYLISDTQLVIIRRLNNVAINLSDITHLEQWDTMGPGVTIRTFGVGGLFGYFGYYYNTSIGKMQFYCTTLKKKIIVVAEGKGKLVISPDDSGMMEELRKRVKLQ